MLETQKMLAKSLRYALVCALALGAAACDGDDDNKDGGSDPTDAGSRDSTNILPQDSGPLPDTGPRPDATPRDAGHFCTNAGAIDVRGTTVNVDEATAAPLSPRGAASVTTCIDEPAPPALELPVTFRGCVTFVGGSTTATDNELMGLELDVFLAKNRMGAVVDPTFDGMTWANRAQPEERIATDVVIDRTPNCGSGVQIEIGRGSVGPASVRSSVEYVIRIRSTAAGGIWATSYHHAAIVFPDRVVGGGGGRCTPQDCTGQFDLLAIRKTAIGAFNTAAGANPAGSADLDDGVGDGYAIVEAWDCGRLPMRNATAGFAPAPAGGGYIIDGTLSTMATATDGSGLYAGLGFTNTSSLAAATVTGAVGILRDADTCTEEFSGAAFRVYPDSVSILRSGRVHGLHN